MKIENIISFGAGILFALMSIAFPALSMIEAKAELKYYKQCLKEMRND